MINATDDLDLDNYKDEGVYYCPSNATATKMSHTPWQISPPSTGNGSGEPFSLIVLRTTGAYARQILLTYPSNNMSIFTRNYTGSWTPASSGTNGWLKISFDGHTHSYISTSDGSVGTNNLAEGSVKLAKLNSDVYDTTPTSGSNKLITSGAVYTLANNKSKVSFSQTKTEGIQIGTITIDGTPINLFQQDNNTTYSADSNNGLQLVNGAFGVKSSGITSDKLSNGSVTTDKINNDAVTSDKISDGNVTYDKLNSNVYDTTVGGSTSNKLITSNAVYNHSHDWEVNGDATLPDDALFLVNSKLRLCQYIDWGKRRFNTSSEEIGRIPREYAPRNGSRVSQIANVGNAYQYNPMIFIDYDGKIGTIATADRHDLEYQVRVSLFWTYIL